MNKIQFKILANPYNNYGFITNDHQKEIDDLNKEFDTSKYNQLYNTCVVDIITYIYKGEIILNPDLTNVNIRIDPNYIRKVIRTDLELIAKLNKKLFEKVNYGDLYKFYSPDLYPLPPIIKNTDQYMSLTTPRSYPSTHYEFFKYEDFVTFNWEVYHRYLTNKFQTLGIRQNNFLSYNQIEKKSQVFNKLIMELKISFNRLRPFQSSQIENIPIIHYITYAGQSPALPSGHSCQGFLFGALVFYYGRDYYNTLDPVIFNDELKLLIRVFKDTGHRRVMTGIHYPSDVIASLIVLKHIINYMGIYSQVQIYIDKLTLALVEF
jgi:hypothetical protein